MNQLFQSAKILTSNMLYQHMMQIISNYIEIQDAILLIPSDEDKSILQVVDVIGNMPSSLSFNNLTDTLDSLPIFSCDITFRDENISIYQHLLKFSGTGTQNLAYLLYRGKKLNEQDAMNFINEVEYLLRIKAAFDSVPGLEHSQSKLKYQLNFFAGVVNNIFEPFPEDILIQLYMEIISEMYSLPAAVILKLEGDVFFPVRAKGVNLSEYEDLVLEALVFLNNWNLRSYPTLVPYASIEQIGENNYKLLEEKHVQIIVPITPDKTLKYLITCISCDDQNVIDEQDKLTLMALSNTLHNAIQFSSTKENLMQSNLKLDNKIYALTAIYRAAGIIFSSTSIDDTVSIALDMLMEIFQSSISSVVISSFRDDRYELKKIKSVNQEEKLEFWFTTPKNVLEEGKVVFDYRNDSIDRQVFLDMFPEFIKLEEKLKPHVILYLTSHGKFYGFITLSERVTRQTYGSEEYEMLTLLANSISLALDNVWMLTQLEEKNNLLERSLQNLYAIQDVLNIVRQARNMDEFCRLLSVALEMGVGVTDLGILAKIQGDLKLLWGNVSLDEVDKEALKGIVFPGLLELGRENELNKRYCVFPVNTNDIVIGYLLVKSFKNSTLEDGERIKLMNIITSIIGETYGRLLREMDTFNMGVLDYSRLILYHLQQEIENLLELQLKPIILKFHHEKPEEIIAVSKDWAEGFVIYPGIGVIISPLDEEEIQDRIGQHNLELQFIDFNKLSLSTLFET